MAGMPPNTAQSPKATSVLQRLRIRRATSSVDELATAPSRMPTSTPRSSGCFKSVMGVEHSRTRCSSCTIRSSMSRNDMWQPAQPASQSEATVTFSLIMVSYSDRCTSAIDPNSTAWPISDDNVARVTQSG